MQFLTPQIITILELQPNASLFKVFTYLIPINKGNEGVERNGISIVCVPFYR